MHYSDQFLPQYQFREQHQRQIPATPQCVIIAAEHYRPEQDPFFRKMIQLREWPQRLLERTGCRPTSGHPPFSMDNFTLLERSHNFQLAYGLMGRFWEAGYGLTPVADIDFFTDTHLPGTARLLLTFQALPIDAQVSVLITETRVFCPDSASLKAFTPYWYLIRPVSGMIRRRMLSAIARNVTGG